MGFVEAARPLLDSRKKGRGTPVEAQLMRVASPPNAHRWRLIPTIPLVLTEFQFDALALSAAIKDDSVIHIVCDKFLNNILNLNNRNNFFFIRIVLNTITGVRFFLSWQINAIYHCNEYIGLYL